MFEKLTFNELKELVSKYTNTEDLRNDNKALYEFLLLDNSILNFKQLKFDKELCRYYAQLCGSRNKLFKKYRKLYNISLENDWIDEFYPESKRKQTPHPSGYWDKKENCAAVAKLCSTPSELQKKYKGAYRAIIRNNWVDELMPISNVKPNGYWDIKEHCAEEAKKYKTRSELLRNVPSAYDSALRNNWLDEFFPNKYSLEYLRKTYPDLENTYFINNTPKEQCINILEKYNTLYDVYNKNIYLYIYLKANNWLNELIKLKQEFEYPEEWNDLEYCKKLLSEYKNREDVFNKNEALYRFGLRHKLLASVFDEFPKGWWSDKDHVREEAKKYKDITSFKNEHFSAYHNFTKWFKNGEIEDIFAEVRQSKPNNYWNNLEHCKEAAATCIDLLEFKHKYIAAWKQCNEHNWLGELGLEENSNDINHEEREYVVYIYTDDINKVVYVGITTQKRIRKRHNEHNSKHYKRGYDSVKTYFNSINKELPAMQVVYNDLTVDEAMIKEDQTMKEYIANGWSILNKAPAGSKSSSIGGKNRYSKKYCTEIARKYKKESEFKKNDLFIYQKVIKYGWINEFDWIELDFPSTDSTADSENPQQTS